MKAHFIIFFTGLLIVGCASQTQPLRTSTQGNLLFDTDFSAADDWRSARTNSATFTANLDDGVFQISNTAESYTWALNANSHDNIIIEADIKLRTDNPNNGYGVGCRMGDGGTGYYFLISRDGYGAIVLATEQVVTPITEWAFYKSVETGINAKNTIRAVCANDYLALYVNNTLLTDTTHERYKSGYVGLLASGSKIGPTQVDFDGVRAWIAIAEGG